jgi:hypothetical protein
VRRGVGAAQRRTTAASRVRTVKVAGAIGGCYPHAQVARPVVVGQRRQAERVEGDRTLAARGDREPGGHLRPPSLARDHDVTPEVAGLRAADRKAQGGDAVAAADVDASRQDDRQGRRGGVRRARVGLGYEAIRVHPVAHAGRALDPRDPRIAGRVDERGRRVDAVARRDR